MYQCRICGRQFETLKNTLPEQAFEPDPNEVDPQLAADQARRRGMTKLAPRTVPPDYVAAEGYVPIMIDGTLHEFKASR